jgi:hypothetical protein
MAGRQDQRPTLTTMAIAAAGSGLTRYERDCPTIAIEADGSGLPDYG